MEFSFNAGFNVEQLCSTIDATVIGRTIKVFRFEPHPRRKVITILGEVTITVVEEDSRLIRNQRTEEFKKSIHLIGLNEESNSERIAYEILVACPFIDESLKPSLVEAVEDLKSKEYDPSGVAILPQTASDGTFLPRYPEVFEDLDDEIEHFDVEEEPDVDINRLTHYVELLYNSIADKIEGTRCIAWLAKSTNYLAVIAEHESALNALFRTLREDCKRSMELTCNILTICLDYARIQDFHKRLINHKIPQATLDIIDFELGRYEQWKMQIQKRKEAVTNANTENTTNVSQDVDKLIGKVDELSLTQTHLLKLAFDVISLVTQTKSVLDALVEHGLISSIVDAMQRRNNTALTETLLKLLRNLSTDATSLKHMSNVGLVETIATTLKDGSPIPKKLVIGYLRLVYNLCFNTDMRHRIVSSGLVPVVANCFEKNGLRDVTCRTLYLISMEPKLRAKLAKISIVNTLMENLVSYGQESPLELIALAVNMSKNKRTCEIIQEHEKLQLILEQGIRNQDPLMLKIIRNLAEHNVPKVLYDAMDTMAEVLATCDNYEFVIQCIEVAAFLDPEKIDLTAWLEKSKLFGWIKQFLNQFLSCFDNKCEEHELDICRRHVLESIILLAVCSQKESGAKILISESYFELMMKVLHCSAAGEQLQEQVAFALFKAVQHELVACYLLSNTTLAKDLLSFLGSATTKVGRIIYELLDKLAEYDESWKSEMIEHRFLLHNKEWVLALPNCAEKPLEDDNANNNNTISQDCGSDQSYESAYSDSEDDTTTLSESLYGSKMFHLYRQQFEEEMMASENNGGGANKKYCFNQNLSQF